MEGVLRARSNPSKLLFLHSPFSSDPHSSSSSKLQPLTHHSHPLSLHPAITVGSPVTPSTSRWTTTTARVPFPSLFRSAFNSGNHRATAILPSLLEDDPRALQPRNTPSPSTTTGTHRLSTTDALPEPTVSLHT